MRLKGQRSNAGLILALIIAIVVVALVYFLLIAPR